MPQACGFDIYPPLPPTPSNRTLYANFITTILSRYSSRCSSLPPTSPSRPTASAARPTSQSKTKTKRNCAQVIPTPGGAYILFIVPGLPILPYNSALCEYFVRFSSASCPALAQDVYEVARGLFGERVQWWWCEDLEGMHGFGVWEKGFVEDRHKEMMRFLEDGWGADGNEKKRLSSSNTPAGFREGEGNGNKDQRDGSRGRIEVAAPTNCGHDREPADARYDERKPENDVSGSNLNSRKLPKHNSRRHGLLLHPRSALRELPGSVVSIEQQTSKGHVEHREDVGKISTLCDRVFARRRSPAI
ncbi:hypothetical protein P280DRAFT_539972 [Massarina eburnea CBS 473.64]|uniref:Uncharacterized protein n=1 Tax=Massarina eburnea CBS 473.64 TaxID=1395130 RepID=A0A6A6RHC4_9PLEO|nr:hypothetical protein P280DRAFT_539972 [Massarina eburnea CBS 473.64]